MKTKNSGIGKSQTHFARKRRIYFSVLALMMLIILAGCNDTSSATPAPTQTTPEPSPTSAEPPVADRDLDIVAGQTIYVPAYSEVFIGRQDSTVELAVTVAIHNTDLDAPIIVQSVRYYDTDGKLVRDFITEPVEIAPLATTGFIVEEQDTTGGWGANFIVEWVAEEPVFEPIVEAIMVGSRGAQGISLTSLGRVISQVQEPQDTEEND